MDRTPRPVLPVLVAILALVAAAPGCGGDDDGQEVSDAQTVRFQKPTEKGPDPFTKPADTRGDDRVDVGSGPFGGTGSDLVCDRELLIRSLRARPDRMREWARVLDIEPDIDTVARYIRQLRAVTLVQDTRVTNHSFVSGRAVAYQAILQAGTAVLVDKDGKPVARCRCGNPLLEPIFIETAKCIACPPSYKPPPPCDYFDYDDSDYRRYDDDEFVDAYDASDYRGKCYRPYPDPPRVKRKKRRPEPEPQPAAQPPPVQTTPDTGLQCDPARSQLEFEQCRDAGRLPSQQEPPTTHTTPPEPQRDPNYECDVDPATPGLQPPAHPGEDWLRNCG